MAIVFTNCSKNSSEEDFTTNQDFNLRSLFDSDLNYDVSFEFSASYDPVSEKSNFTTKAQFVNGAIDGDVFFNSTPIPVFENRFLNDYNVNPNSFENFDLGCKKAIGTIGKFEAKNFNSISDFEVNSYIPQFISPVIISNTNGISINWNIDTNLNNNIFGVLLTYDNANGTGVAKSYFFDQSLGNGNINNTELISIPQGTRIKLFYTRGNVLYKDIADKKIRVVAYTFGSKTVIKK